MTNEPLDKQILYEQIRRYAARLLGNAGACAEAGEDIAQEVFLRLEQQRGAVQQLHPWAYRTARNLVIDRFRKAGKTGTADDLDELPADATRFNPAILAEQKETLEMLKLKMNELSPRHREVLRLKFQEGLKYAEIAEVLGEPVTTVAWLIHEAVEKLRQDLKAGHS